MLSKIYTYYRVFTKKSPSKAIKPTALEGDERYSFFNKHVPSKPFVWLLSHNRNILQRFLPVQKGYNEK